MDIINNQTGYVFEQGYSIIGSNGTAIVGMSPGNSYFKKETIEDLLTECTKNFSKIIVMIPDMPAVHTSKACGYNDMKAEREARLNVNALTNKMDEILPDIRKDYSGKIEVAKWNSQEAKSQEYEEEYENIIQLYKNNTTFRNDARNTTQSVIKNKMKPGLDLEKSVDEGVKYLLSELAFLNAYTRINNTKIAYVYHKPWPIYENYVNGVYGEKKSNLGFVIIE
jgi:cyclo(L-tyrosyl-L-tyrosyl) synthase